MPETEQNHEGDHVEGDKVEVPEPSETESAPEGGDGENEGGAEQE